MTTMNKMPSTTQNTSTLIAGRDVKEFQIVPPMIDVRGWQVALSDGAVVGTIERVMLDAQQKRPRYFAVTHQDRKGHLLIPVGYGTLDRTAKRVLLGDLKPDVVKALPQLDLDNVTWEAQRQIFSAFTGKPASSAPSNEQLYAEPLFDATRLFGAKETGQKA